jgi:hypothetical protein
MFNNAGRKIKFREWSPMDIINKIFKESPARITNILLALSFAASTAKIILTAINTKGPHHFITMNYIVSFAVCALIIIYTSYYFETDRTQILFPTAFIIMAASAILNCIYIFIDSYNYSYNIQSYAITITIAIDIFFLLTYIFTAFSAFKKFKWIIIAEVSYSVIFLLYLYPIFRNYISIFLYYPEEIGIGFILKSIIDSAAPPLFTAGILLFFLLNISKLGKKNKTSADTQKLEQQLFSNKQHE